MSDSQKIYYTWEQFDEDCVKIASWARAQKNINRIYGIPRGGLVPAVMLSHMLGWPLVFKRENIQENTLIVDDIVDTGKTLERLFQNIDVSVPVASLHYHEDSCMEPQFYCRTKDAWIVYPWETESSSRYDGTI